MSTTQDAFCFETESNGVDLESNNSQSANSHEQTVQIIAHFIVVETPKHSLTDVFVNLTVSI